MATSYIGQILIGGWNFAPRNTAFCAGQLIPIAQNTALFSLLGTNYGGNGQTTFGLPDLRGRAALGQGSGPGLSQYVLGEVAGSEGVSLLSTEIPAHTHTTTFTSTSALNSAQVSGTNQQAQASPQSMLANGVDGAVVPAAVPRIYAPAASTPTVPLGGLNVAGTVALAVAGGGQPHNNMQPYLTVNFVIVQFGIFPARN
jgi:microcystin-dependent protein